MRSIRLSVVLIFAVLLSIGYLRTSAQQLGQTTSDTSPRVTSEPGIDRPGADFWLISMDGPAVAGPCALYCRSTPRCAAYTLVEPLAAGGQYQCYLKESAPPPVRNSCCRSGVKENFRPLTADQLARDARLRRVPNVGRPVGNSAGYVPPPAVPVQPYTPPPAVPVQQPVPPPAIPVSTSAPAPSQADSPYRRMAGRYEGGGEFIVNNLSSGDRRWPTAVAFDVAGCETACTSPARFTGGQAETRPCVAYSFMRAHGPYEGTCTTYSAVPPRLVPDDYTTSGRRP